MHSVYKYHVADVWQPVGYRLAAAAMLQPGGGRQTGANRWCNACGLIKAKVHYTSWFGVGSEPVRSWFGAGSEPAGVMEFGR